MPHTLSIEPGGAGNAYFSVRVSAWANPVAAAAKPAASAAKCRIFIRFCLPVGSIERPHGRLVNGRGQRPSAVSATQQAERRFDVSMRTVAPALAGSSRTFALRDLGAVG